MESSSPVLLQERGFLFAGKAAVTAVRTETPPSRSAGGGVQAASAAFPLDLDPAFTPGEPGDQPTQAVSTAFSSAASALVVSTSTRSSRA